tara:strand:+ start:1452 stop:1730 length:279 start_codon:yes stop_codon:yes gene_type:complete
MTEKVDKIKEMLEARQAPGAIIRHPAGQTKYISTLARYPDDPRANVTSMSEARRKAAQQGKEILTVDQALDARKEVKQESFSDTFKKQWKES